DFAACQASVVLGLGQPRFPLCRCGPSRVNATVVAVGIPDSIVPDAVFLVQDVRVVPVAWVDGQDHDLVRAGEPSGQDVTGTLGVEQVEGASWEEVFCGYAGVGPFVTVLRL